MTTRMVRFNQFKVGDYTCFNHSFTLEDFAAFSRLSGDTNPLHHDQAFATASGFNRPIVPVHLTLAPLSRIAGMVFPGDPSLYLGHRLEAVAPVYYGDQITYSARIVAIHASHRVLTLKVIAFRGQEVLLSAEMKVQALQAEWPESERVPRSRGFGTGTALITGAGGAIGSATALRLAKQGWNLMLCVSARSAKAEALLNLCKGYGVQVTLLAGDLEEPGVAAVFAAQAAEVPDLSLFVHAASPGIRSSLSRLLAVNVTAMKEMVDRIVPRFLSRQTGTVVYLGSSAVQHQPAGWEDYALAKLAGTQYLTSLHRRLSGYGLRCLTLAPGYVQTPFSDGFRPQGQQALLPEQIAECIDKASRDALGLESYVSFEPGTDPQAGRFGFVRSRLPESVPQAPGAPLPGNTGKHTEAAGAEEASGPRKLVRILQSVFGLDGETDLSSLELGVTPQWDSLRHIELLLEIEKDFGITITSAEMDRTRTFDGLVQLISPR